MNVSTLAPVVLFVYNRYEHTKKTIEALKSNELAEYSNLFIFSDGAKKEENIKSVQQVRTYIYKIEGFKSVSIIEREKNIGLAESVINGVTEILKKFGKVIVLEDDIVTAPCFLTYMNKALEFYINEKKVFSISGYSYTTNVKNRYLDGNYFFKMGECWSWATWKDRWDYFDKDASGWQELLYNSKMRYEFNLNNSYDYTTMLKSQMENNINSWAIRWYWSVFRQNGLTLYPQKAIISNIGLDGSGVHCSRGEISGNILNNNVSYAFPEEVYEKSKIRLLIIKEIRKQRIKFSKKVIVKSKLILRNLFHVNKLFT